MEDQESKPNKQKVVCSLCCIGDIHGYITKLHNLWSNLETDINPSDFQSALIIFLGDYCDRGYNTPQALDFLISLPSKYPKQTHVFLCGNHDLAFAGFLGVLPAPADGSKFCETWSEYEQNEEREGWYRGEEYERMHVQARRWAGKMSGFNVVKKTEYKGSIYDAGPTFESYGVPHGSVDLIKAVPAEHKKFLANMVWVHEEDNVCIETEKGFKQCKLIAVHAGLEKNRGVEEQLKYLKARDTRIPKVEAPSGRKNVWEMPKELEGLADPLKKEVSVVRKKIDSVNKQLKPLGYTCQKKEKEYKDALEAFNEKNKEKVQLITRLMELVSESEKLRMKKLEELSKSIELN